MPVIFKKQLNASVSVCLWQIIETEAFFSENYFLNPKDLIEIQNIKLENRRLEKWACRAALSELSGEKTISIIYSKNGQPIFHQGFISFSHTKDFVLVVLSDRPVGTDIEKIAPRILNLKHKFMNQQEMNSFDSENPKDVTLIWCAKESVFKWYAKGDVDFLNDILITKNPFQALIKNEKEIPLYQMEYLGFMIVITI
jgi:4'-phosphopantetheinyl transferase